MQYAHTLHVLVSEQYSGHAPAPSFRITTAADVLSTSGLQLHNGRRSDKQTVQRSTVWCMHQMAKFAICSSKSPITPATADWRRRRCTAVSNVCVVADLKGCTFPAYPATQRQCCPSAVQLHTSSLLPKSGRLWPSEWEAPMRLLCYQVVNFLRSSTACSPVSDMYHCAGRQCQLLGHSPYLSGWSSMMLQSVSGRQ